jgi:serine/threonine-protein kinase
MQPGTRVAHFEIVSMIGRGGMGEVFRARDGKLKRDVALKTLPPTFSSDPDRLARFEREATSLAALNHPNIASIYGIEEQDGARYLVLELVEGSTLDERLMRGALPLDEALEIALRIASAIESAHGRGVIHRDLKPANIKAPAGGGVKVLDFGLAKSVASPSSAADTKTPFGTEVGLIVGTPPYMSPEQARGENAGPQTDIWSFGVILYEMLTGLSPFKRDTIPGTLARVLEAEPDFAKLPASTPPAVRRLLRRCLEKDLKSRTQHIGDARIELEEALAGDDAADRAATRPPKWRSAAIAAALIAVGSVGGLAVWSLASRDAADAPAEPVRLSIASLEQPFRQPYGITNIAISDDGRRVAYAASSDRMLVRDVGSPDSVFIGEPGLNPFFSPDGQWIGFWNMNGGIVKVRSTGGEPITVQQVSERPLGAMWGTDGNIVYATAAGVFRVSANGGAAELLAAADQARGERAYAWPKPLPGGAHVLLTVLKGQSLATAEIAILDLATRAVTPLLPAGVAAQYAASGHLVFVANQNLQAIEFDAATRQPRGTTVQLSNGNVAVAPDNGAAQFSIAGNGTLLFMPPRPPSTARSLVWVDRAGGQEAAAFEPGPYSNPRVSPDGTRVALDVIGTSSRDIWIFDLQRSASTRLTTSAAEDFLPLWSADGSRVFFSSGEGGSTDLYSQAADGASSARLELGGAPVHIASSVTPDGARVIVYEDFRDLKAFVVATGAVEPVLTSNFDERLGEISPDGRWIAYESDESGAQVEVFVRPFPEVADGRLQVSTAGGRYPRWRRPGSNELFYVTPDGSVMAASIATIPSLRVSGSAKLFEWERPPTGRSGAPYDVSPLDGRFLMTKRSAPAARNDAEISVVLNWFTEVRRATGTP